MEYRHHVPEATRDQSRFDPEHSVYVTPNGGTWQYVDPGSAHGQTTLDGEGNIVLVAQWISDQEHLPFSECLTKEQADEWQERLDA